MRGLQLLLAEIARPEAGADPYRWAVIALGHAMLGAALSLLVALIGLPMIPHLVAVVLLYAIGKEMRDLARGGRVMDSVTDSFFVGVGVMHPFASLWPLVAFAAVALGVGLRRWP